MLDWSIHLFRVRGIRIAVHFSFFLLLAYVAYSGWSDGGGVRGLLWNCAFLIAFVGCVVLHELGHSLTAMNFGIGVRRILLLPIGGMAQFDEIPREPSRELMITLAGPVVNFGIAALLWGWTFYPHGDLPLYTVRGFIDLLFWANLTMGCFNLLPVFPMDGGRILRALLAMRMPYLRATAWAAAIGKVLAIVGVLLALFVFKFWMLTALFTFVLFLGDAEYRAVKQLERDEEEWRELERRAHVLHHSVSAHLEEPPFLSPTALAWAKKTPPE